jgi:flagellar biosynthesis GTPase FlhF
MSAKADGHFAANILEMQKVKEGLACQAASNFSNTQLEILKAKECLSSQSAVQFAAAQLDAHKNREAIQKDLADAKYEALKSQQLLADKIDECCCSVKEKMDVIDRDRLRDNLIVAREDNNVLKILEFGGYGGYGRGYGGRGDRGDHHGRH